MIDGQNWGVLEIDAEEPHAFDLADIEFLTAYANIIGLALARFEAAQTNVKQRQEITSADAVWKTLVRELQHRTKNNLQTIIGFLALQRKNESGEDTKRRFTKVMDQVQAIALAHEQLSLRDGTSNVEFGAYLRSLCANIAPQETRITVEIEANYATMPLDRAVPAGLIVNELVTNALKYAFEEDQDGVIRVAFVTNGQTGEATITVQDNGKGMGSPRTGGLGLALIEALTQQLAGRVAREQPKKGTRTDVCFPLAL
jgi:two-component sensor histidine kinase